MDSSYTFYLILRLWCTHPVLSFPDCARDTRTWWLKLRNENCVAPPKTSERFVDQMCTKSTTKPCTEDTFSELKIVWCCCIRDTAIAFFPLSGTFAPHYRFCICRMLGGLMSIVVVLREEMSVCTEIAYKLQHPKKIDYSTQRGKGLSLHFLRSSQNKSVARVSHWVNNIRNTVVRRITSIFSKRVVHILCFRSSPHKFPCASQETRLSSKSNN